MERLRQRAPDLLAVTFGVSSVVHLLRPQVFDSIVPGWLPNRRAIVTVSGVTEVLCAIALARRWRWSGRASALVLVAVFPGNIQMAVNSVHDANGRITLAEVLAFIRLPLQAALVWAALQANRSGSSIAAALPPATDAPLP